MKPLQPNIRQVVPPAWCADCDVCCRFPEKNSFLAPYFTREEITAAISPFNKGGLRGIFNVIPAQAGIQNADRGLDSHLRGNDECLEEFSGESKHGCKITLIPYREGYICRAFDPATIQCKIYDARPLDCRLYPFAIMWSLSGKEVLLGMDTKCPFVTEHAEDDLLNNASLEITSALESPPLLDILA